MTLMISLWKNGTFKTKEDVPWNCCTTTPDHTASTTEDVAASLVEDLLLQPIYSLDIIPLDDYQFRPLQHALFDAHFFNESPDEINRWKSDLV